MPKISELVPDEMLGKVKVRCPSWKPHEYFTPYFKDRYDRYHGPSESGDPVASAATCVTFQLFTEPKPKVKRWLWVFKSYNGMSLHTFYKTEQEAKDYFDVGKYEKCEWSEKEFDE